MYSTLRAEIARKEFKITDLAKRIGMADSTLSHKINGKSPWTLSECRKVQKALEVNMTIDDLFKED